MTTRSGFVVAAISVASAVALVAVASTLVVGADQTERRSHRVDSAVRPTTTAAPTSAPTTVAATTTSIVVERVSLPPNTREVATVLPRLPRVAVSSSPPPGWDVSLSPVVSPVDERAPRSGLDVGRVALPSAEEPISGRHVTETGWSFANPTTFTPAQPLLFSVVSRQGPWIEVALPVRPNGTTGWIHGDLVTLSATTLRVDVSLAERVVRVSDAGIEIFSAPAGVGRPSTPTPTGSFFVTDIVPSLNPAGGYGPVALALNGYSEVMDRFAGESGVGAPDEVAPVLALHGTNQPSSVGQARSNGCPRLYNHDIVRLAELVPTGTPVEIWP